ncbi:XRE family transcriptional regulator [Pararhodonellum marinum]|uniref:XRE family transcriptional regulator n=1 Tax=Pararhodonellum marinum TaxID=2755358 RepID=UPI00188E75CC|nr:XRE family transcriptional regulator [Pararhodonellum marinum]
MRKPKIKMLITKEDKGYSANVFIQNKFIATEGESFDELQENILEAVNLAFEDKGHKYSVDEVKFEYDLGSFFDFYKVINAKALSERIGMNQSLLAQYIKGIKKPSAAQTKRILQGVQQIGRELSEVRFLL